METSRLPTKEPTGISIGTQQESLQSLHQFINCAHLLRQCTPPQKMTVPFCGVTFVSMLSWCALQIFESKVTVAKSERLLNSSSSRKREERERERKQMEQPTSPLKSISRKRFYNSETNQGDGEYQTPISSSSSQDVLTYKGATNHSSVSSPSNPPSFPFGHILGGS